MSYITVPLYGEAYFLESDLVRKSRKLIGRENEVIFKICLRREIEIFYRGKTIKEAFKLEDSQLNNLIQRSFVEKLEQELLSGETDEKRAGISFLFAYLNNYRGLKKQSFSFGSRYHYNVEEKKLERCEQQGEQLTGLYGSNIHSIFCIVGKNGVGKTSFVDFLCESFLFIVNQIDNTQKELTEIFKETGIEDGTDVLVVFEYAGVPYVITNIKQIKYAEELPVYFK